MQLVLSKESLELLDSEEVDVSIPVQGGGRHPTRRSAVVQRSRQGPRAAALDPTFPHEALQFEGSAAVGHGEDHEAAPLHPLEDRAEEPRIVENVL